MYAREKATSTRRNLLIDRGSHHSRQAKIQIMSHLFKKIQDCYAMTIKGGVKDDMACTWDTNTFPFLPNQASHCVAILYLLRPLGVAALNLTAMG
jgi:hypothetical protein